MSQYRKSPRLRDYDYSQAGAYFVTICTHLRKHLFGKVHEDEVHLSDFGQVALNRWQDLPNHYANIHLDDFVIMPNYIHGIIFLLDFQLAESRRQAVGDGLQTTLYETPLLKRHALPEIIREFKTYSARRINDLRESTGIPVWQRSFHDHIIRNEEDLNRIRGYIQTNPSRWTADTYYSDEV